MHRASISTDISAPAHPRFPHGPARRNEPPRALGAHKPFEYDYDAAIPHPVGV
ncbi:MAG: hypothetical protein ACRD0K_19290 [Egibacteraceae bacterium]